MSANALRAAKAIETTGFGASKLRVVKPPWLSKRERKSAPASAPSSSSLAWASMRTFSAAIVSLSCERCMATCTKVVVEMAEVKVTPTWQAGLIAARYMIYSVARWCEMARCV